MQIVDKDGSCLAPPVETLLHTPYGTLQNNLEDTSLVYTPEDSGYTYMGLKPSRPYLKSNITAQLTDK